MTITNHKDQQGTRQKSDGRPHQLSRASEVMDLREEPTMEKNLQWRRTYNGEEPTMEKNRQWRRTYNGGEEPTMEKNLQWRRTYNGKEPTMKKNRQPLLY
jgi:bisphosphoglycerate-dependent phosphoglycerate mutase